MSDMLKTFVKAEIDENINKEHPHLRYPASVYARVTGVSDHGSYNSYIIKILDKNKKEDHKYPEIPQVLSDGKFHEGEIIVVAFLYGDIMPYIIGKVI